MVPQRGKWHSYMFWKKHYTFGSYRTEEEAAMMYDQACIYRVSPPSSSFSSASCLYFFSSSFLFSSLHASHLNNLASPFPDESSFTCFLSGMNPMTNSRNCTCQQSSENRRDQCVCTKVSGQSMLAGSLRSCMHVGKTESAAFCFRLLFHIDQSDIC